MSDRSFKLLTGALGAAILLVLAVSYWLGRLAPTPLSMGLLGLLIVIPAGLLMRFLPMLLIGRSMPAGFRERMAQLRQPPPRYAVRLCLASLAASYCVAVSVALFDSRDPNSWIFGGLMLAALGLFMYGWLGLIYTSAWVQTHGMLLAAAGLVIVVIGVGLFGYEFSQPFVSFSMILLQLTGMVTGVCLITTPIQISFARAWGLIE